MAFQTIVYGYIQSVPNRDEETRTLMQAFPFDSVFPFTNIFHGPYPGYQWSIIPFASSVKNLFDEYDLWLSRFEQFLTFIRASSAHVDVVSERGMRDSVEYVRILKSPDIVSTENRIWFITTIKNVCGISRQEERVL